MHRFFFILFSLVGCFGVVSLGFAETMVMQKGVASSEDENKVNIEILRQRAIRNAMDLAVMQVTGAVITSQKGDSLRYQEEMTTKEDKTSISNSQRTRFQSGVTTRIQGHASLVEILKEWREGGTYFVEARISVTPPEEIAKKKRCGDYWAEAGKPPVTIEIIEDEDGEISPSTDSQTLRFFRDNLVKNGVQLSTNKSACEYVIAIHQQTKSRDQEDLGIITMQCGLSYEIVDTALGRAVADYRKSHGPQAGFTYDQAKDACVKNIAPEVSEDLIRSFAKLMSDRWNNGLERNIVIEGIPGLYVARASDIIRNLYRVTWTASPLFQEQVYKGKIRFKGSEPEFSQSLQDAFHEEDWSVSLSGIGRGEIRFEWLVK